MKKIWIGGYTSCGNHNEIAMIENYIKEPDYGLTEKIEEADIIIVIDTCLGTYQKMVSSFECIEEILKRAKIEAKTIVSGCLTKGVKFELTERQKELLSKVEIVKQEQLVPYVAQMLRGTVTSDDFDIPYSVNGVSISISPVSGCLNYCSFCKSHYMNFGLKSYPFEKVESLAYDIETIDYPFHHVAIHASNFSLYGTDLYGKPRAHEVIKNFTSPDKIKYAYVGSLINWYPELVEEIIKNPKIKEIFISLESGSPRVYKLMNRPISLNNLIRLIKFIKKERPDIIIITEFIAGYPTETIDDLKRSIDLVTELDIFPCFIWPYENSEQIPSSTLPGHSYDYCVEAANYVKRELFPLSKKFKDQILNGEMFVLKKSDKRELYITMLINGMIRNVRFDQLDRDYQEEEVIPANIVKPKQFVKRKF